MEALTELRFEGSDRVHAHCPTCNKWIDEVEIIENCHPYNRTYAMCPACHTGIVRSDPIAHA
jgi:hypothetical protein